MFWQEFNTTFFNRLNRRDCQFLRVNKPLVRQIWFNRHTATLRIWCWNNLVFYLDQQTRRFDICNNRFARLVSIQATIFFRHNRIVV